MTTVHEVAEKLTALVREGRFLDAVDRCYAPDIVSVEAIELPGIGREQRGFDAVRGKNVWWLDNHDILSDTVDGPYLGAGPTANRFAVHYVTEVRRRATGERLTIDEMALYTVEGGKVVREQFFYPGG